MATPEELRRKEKELALEKELLAVQRSRIGISAREKADSDDYANALASALKEIKNQGVEKRELLSISNRLTKATADEFALTSKELRGKKALTDIQNKRAKVQKDMLNLSRLANQITTKDQKLQGAINELVAGRLKTATSLSKEYEKQEEILNKISSNPTIKALSGAGNLFDKLGVGQLGEFLTESADELSEVMLSNELTKEGKGERVEAELAKLSQDDIKTLQGDGTGITKDFMQSLSDKDFDTSIFEGKLGTEASKMVGGDVANLGPSIGKALKPLSKFGAMLKLLGKFLKKAMLLNFVLIDKKIGDAAKSLNITYKEAQNVSSEANAIANATGDIFVTGKKVLGTFQELNSALGTTGTLTSKSVGQLAADLTLITERSGMTVEEFMGMANLSLTTGENLQDITGEFMASAKMAGVQNGVMLNTKDLAKSVSELSAATTLSFSKNPKLLGEALAVTKALGMEMEQLEGIASGLMNFEESIKNELEAELLLGKNINLEKARQAALNNDLATLASEIAEQAGTSAEFAEMNRIQQEALAQAVGMSRDELAETLFTQEQLAGLTGEEAEETERLLNARIAEVGLAQAQKELAKEGVEGLKNQASQADRLLAVMDKLNEVLVAIVEPLMPILDIFVSIAEVVGTIMKFLDPMIQTTLVGVGLIQDLVSGIMWLFGDDDAFEGGSATMNQIAKAEQSAQDNYGFSFNTSGKVKMAEGGLVVNGPVDAIVGEAGPEAVIPLNNQKGINVDNSKMEAILANIDKNLSKQKPMTPFMVSVG